MKNETPLYPCPLPLKVKGTTLMGGKRTSSFWCSGQVCVAVQFIATNSVGAVSNREKIGSL